EAAIVYTRTRNLDKAFEWLFLLRNVITDPKAKYVAVEELRANPFLRDLRDDVRWQKIVINYPPRTNNP
ncbi:MAG: hypothetical protein NZ108_05675, partial [Bacteroidia bacterium]|nr:hypothetical protein [Bacteroidia bacterium]